MRYRWRLTGRVRDYFQWTDTDFSASKEHTPMPKKLYLFVTPSPYGIHTNSQTYAGNFSNWPNPIGMGN